MKNFGGPVVMVGIICPPPIVIGLTDCQILGGPVPPPPVPAPLQFRVAAAQCRKICPEVLNWPGRLAGISEGATGCPIEVVPRDGLPF